MLPPGPSAAVAANERQAVISLARAACSGLAELLGRQDEEEVVAAIARTPNLRDIHATAPGRLAMAWTEGSGQGGSTLRSGIVFTPESISEMRTVIKRMRQDKE